MQVLNATALFLALLPAMAAQDVVRTDLSGVVSGEADLEALRQQYAAAVNARDVQQSASLYATDALASFDGIVLRGSDAIARRIGQASTPGAVITLLPRQFSSSSAVASETGTFVETRPEPDRTISVEGVYVTVYARGADGRWRIAMEVRATGSVPATGVRKKTSQATPNLAGSACATVRPLSASRRGVSVSTVRLGERHQSLQRCRWGGCEGAVLSTCA